MKRILSLIVIVALVATMMMGCSEGSGTGKGEIRFANAQWDSIMFHNAVAGLIAEEVYGYTWIEVPGSTTVLHEGIINGEVDVHMEEWTDNIATYQTDLEAGKFQEFGVNFDDNSQGIYFPRYVIEGDAERGIEASARDLKYVWDLKNYPDVFQDADDKDMGAIYGAIPGWEVDEIMFKKYQHYGLDENFNYIRPGSDAALSAAITSAYEKGEAIAAYYWEPTWLMGKYDFVLLEDEPFDENTYLEGKTALPEVRVTIGASNDFVNNEENADFIEFLEKYQTSSELTSEALAHMQDTGDDYNATARWFLAENDELLDQWLSEEDANKIRAVLE